MTFFSGGIDHLARAIKNGGLDFYLLKPMTPLYQVTVARVSLTGFLNGIFAALFWVFVLTRYPAHYDLSHWFWAIALFINGIVINIAMRLIITCVAFWTVEGGSLNWLF